jgi:hypothetical protein
MLGKLLEADNPERNRQASHNPVSTICQEPSVKDSQGSEREVEDHHKSEDGGSEPDRCLPHPFGWNMHNELCTRVFDAQARIIGESYRLAPWRARCR